MTNREWLDSARIRLAGAGVESASLEAQLLAGHVLRENRPWLIAHAEEPFPELAGESVLSRRLLHEPLAYILGWREFYGRRFSVGPGVLIPRQDTEVLVTAALKLVGADSRRVLDLGAGSGCIGITMKLENPLLSVLESDVSPLAIEMALRNAGDLGAAVDFAVADGLAAFRNESFDAIVSNPPYIGLDELLPTEVANYEPSVALYSGHTGMEFYERLAAEAKQCLKPDGHLLMEVGYRQSETVAELFASNGWWRPETVQDFAGIERVVICSAR